MSFVLILKPSGRGEFPATIGGYKTQAEAEAAGRLACKPPCVRGMSPEQEMAFYQANAVNPYEVPWSGYTVIPGAACPGGAA